MKSQKIENTKLPSAKEESEKIAITQLPKAEEDSEKVAKDQLPKDKEDPEKKKTSNCCSCQWARSKPDQLRSLRHTNPFDTFIASLLIAVRLWSHVLEATS